jgi:hypothetical protein
VTCKQAHAEKRLLRHFRLLAVVLGTILLASLPCYSIRASAQDLHKHYALIFGTVWGPDNRPVYGVKVLIRRANQKKPKWELYSNHTGEFAQRVPAGQAVYIIRADAKSVKAISNNKLHPGSEVTVHIVAEERVDIGLHLN